MSGNQNPQFTAVGDIQSSLFGGTALATSDGSGGTYGTSVIAAFIATTNGSYVEAIRILTVASTAATVTAATTVRIYVSSVTSGSSSTANTWLVAELALPSVTADQATVATNWFDMPLGFRLPAGYAISVSSHVVNNANTNLRALVIGGDY